METSFTAISSLLVFSFLIAFVYSSVGHGGASGYLALLSFFSFSHEQMASSALCLNLLVSGMAFFIFSKAKHFSWKLTWPFVASSIPLAFLGGLVEISRATYGLLLASVLVFAGFRMFVDSRLTREESGARVPGVFYALIIGGGIGLVSGIVGVGGGIFLSPLVLLFHWANAKQTAATSAFFIFVNSFAGLLGRAARQNVDLEWSGALLAMVFVTFLGGIAGSRLGANRFSHQWLKRILGLVLFAAAFKLFRVPFSF